MKKLYLIILLLLSIGLSFSCQETKPIENNDDEIIDTNDKEVVDKNDDKEVIDNNDDINEPPTKEIKKIDSLSINGETVLLLGYRYSFTLTILPNDANEEVVWSCDDEDIATIDNNGVVYTVNYGKTKITATSLSGEAKATFKIKVISEINYTFPNLGGYEIVIMDAESSLGTIDPFSDYYRADDKLVRQKAQREIENEFNCKIKYVGYPALAPWGEMRMNWIIDNAKDNNSQADFLAIPSYTLGKYVKENCLVNLSEYYKCYGFHCMDKYQYDGGIINDKLYSIPSIADSDLFLDICLIYNYGLVKRLELDDPATLFNDGKWTYSEFEKWVIKANDAFKEDGVVLAGEPYYYYTGLTSAAGIKVVDNINMTINLKDEKVKNITSFIQKLYNLGYADKIESWGPGFTSGLEDSFYNEKSIMTTGLRYYVGASSRFHKDLLNWNNPKEIGVVPFPYPDNMEKKDTRAFVSSIAQYVMPKGRSYPAGISEEFIYQAICFLYQRNKEYIDEYNEENNVEEKAKEKLRKVVDNEASVEAIMYFNHKKAIFDPVLLSYESVVVNPLYKALRRIVLNNEDYDEVIDEIYDDYYNDFISLYQ